MVKAQNGNGGASMDYNFDDLGYYLGQYDEREGLCRGCTEEDCSGCPFNHGDLYDIVDRDLTT